MTIEEQPSNVDNDLPPRYSQINLLATNHHARVDSIAASRQQQPPTQHEVYYYYYLHKAHAPISIHHDDLRCISLHII